VPFISKQVCIYNQFYGYVVLGKKSLVQEKFNRPNYLTNQFYG